MDPKKFIKEIKKITITKAAQELGYSRVQISNLCNGKAVGRKLGEKFIKWAGGQVGWSDIFKT